MFDLGLSGDLRTRVLLNEGQGRISMKRMLINASQPEELRVAMVDGQYLYNLDIEVRGRTQKKSSIYKGRVTRVEPSLEAAFVEYGGERHGFLPFKDVAREYFADPNAENAGKLTIKEALREGQEVIVQVEKEERGTKGAALTTFPSLAGRYLVLMPNNPRAGGISRRIEGDDRGDLRDVLSQLEVPAGMGLIVRTAGVGRAVEELQWDLNYLLNLWEAISKAADERTGTFLIHQDSNVIIRAIRDYFSQDLGEIVVDSQAVHDEACDFMRQVMPDNLSKVKLYSDDVPLFSRYQIESQIESAYSHTVQLPSGGAIVIDHTEALISIDINSARATKGSDIEETALNTNLEAADEVARQLRLRDVGGLIVIDFIDMTPTRNQREVETRLRDALEQDRARIQTGRISRFGLLEMSRQRLRPSLGESALKVCPSCNGQGSIRGAESMALSVLRLLEEQALKDKTGIVVATLAVDVGTYLLNEKREAIYQLEKSHGVRVVVVPDPAVLPAQFTVERIRDDDREHEAVRKNSFELVDADRPIPEFVEQGAQANNEQPAVRAVAPQPPVPTPPSTPAPVVEAVQVGFFPRIWNSLFAPAPKEEKPTRTERPARRRPDTRNSNQRSRSSERGNDRNNDRSSTPERSAGRGGDTAQQEQRRRGSGNGSGGTAQRTRSNSDARRTGQGRNSARNDDLGESQSKARVAKNEEAAAASTVAAVSTAEENQPASTPEIVADGEAGQRRARSRGRRGRRGGNRNRRTAEQGAEGTQDENSASADGSNSENAPSSSTNSSDAARASLSASPSGSAAPESQATATVVPSESSSTQQSPAPEPVNGGNADRQQGENNAGGVQAQNSAIASPSAAQPSSSAQDGDTNRVRANPPPSATSSAVASGPAAANSAPTSSSAASGLSADDVTVVRAAAATPAVAQTSESAIVVKQEPQE
jgi:ribonuclease E